MMLRVIPIRVIITRVIVFLFLFSTFYYNLSVYDYYSETIKHYKPYYAEAYFYALQHKLSSINTDSTTNAAQAVTEAKSVPVLVYHGIVDRSDPVSQSLTDFKNQMFELKRRGYQTVHIDKYYEYVMGKTKLPDKSFLLTFDDGRKDSFYPVDPILAELNYSAVMFVITGTFDFRTHNFHLVKGEYERIAKTGRWDLESHTFKGHREIVIDDKGKKGHFLSNKEWLVDKNRLETDDEYRTRITYDLDRSKIDLLNAFDINSMALAFPYNDYGQQGSNFPGAEKIIIDVSSKVFPMLFHQADPERGFVLDTFNQDAFMNSRIDVDPAWNQAKLLDILGTQRIMSLALTGDNRDQIRGSSAKASDPGIY